jgi:hypothetical protein
MLAVVTDPTTHHAWLVALVPALIVAVTAPGVILRLRSGH